jgi:3-oxoacyl-(acyl-carrier-protein) synthase
MRERTAVSLATCLGNSTYHLDQVATVTREGLGHASALLFAESVYNAATSHIAKVHDLRGPNETIVAGEDSGLAAVAAGADLLVAGRADAVLAGGADQYDGRTHAALAAQGWLGAAEAALPWGEGAALLRIERDAPVALACLTGWASARGARALIRATERALADAGCEAAALDLVVISGSRGAGEHELVRMLASRRHSLRACWLGCWTGQAFAGGSALAAVVAVLAVAQRAAPLERPDLAPLAPTPVQRALAVGASSLGSASALVLEVPPPKP